MADSSTLVDRVKMFVESSGTGPFQLGNAVPSFRGSEALTDGLTYSYAVESGSDYEVGQGVYVQAVDQLLRAPTLSSAGGAPVAFPANVTINFTALAADLTAGLAGTGTVTSIQGSGGTTGMTLTGGPITGAGTLTLGGTLGLANGGTGGTTAPEARSGIGLGNVDNTSDADKPISTETQAALDERALITDLASPTGGEMVGFQQIGAGAVLRNQLEKSQDVVNVLDFIPVAQHAAILAGTSSYNAAADVQAAIDSVNTLQGGTLIVRGKVFLGASVNIDRPVGTTVGDLFITGLGNGAGFHCTAAITMFDSTLAVTADPLSERVIFTNVNFSVASAATAAYVISQKFLRVEFNTCRFERIKCNTATIYMQSWRWNNCSAWRWNGIFSHTATNAYDCHLSACNFEGAGVGGDGLSWSVPQGCSAHQNLFEGANGAFIRCDGCNGFSVSGNYTENFNTTNPDYIFANAGVGGVAKGISFTGNHINSISGNPATFYCVILGDCIGFSGGNSSNINLFDNTNTVPGNFISSGDSFVGRLQKTDLTLANYPAAIKTLTSGIVAHAGGGQGSAVLLPAQTNVIATVASVNDSVILPAMTGGLSYEAFVLNVGANTCHVYPPVGYNFAGLGTNAPDSLAGGGASRTYRYVGAGVWTA